MNSSQKSITLITCIGLIIFASLILIFCQKKNAKPYPEIGISLEPFAENLSDDPNQQLYRAKIVKISENGDIFVLDSGNHRIVQYDSSGKFVKQIGSVGQGPGDLLHPDYFDLKNNKLFVVENGNKRVSIFSISGNFIHSFKIPSFPQAMIYVNSRDEIYLNQPTIGGYLFDVYDSTGQKIRSLIPAEPFEHPAFKGPNPLATWAYNQVYIQFDKNDNIFAFFVARPLYRYFSNTGELLMEKNIQLPEIDTTKCWAERNRKSFMERMKKEPNPNSISYIGFFYNFCLLPDNDIIIRMTDKYNTFYQLDKNGNPKKKFTMIIPENSPDDELIILDYWGLKGNNEMIGLSSYFSQLYRIKLNDD